MPEKAGPTSLTVYDLLFVANNLFSLAVWFLIFWFVFQYKLCRVKKVCMGPKKVPYIVTHDGRTIRYPDPLVKANDTVKIDITTGKIDDFIKFDSGKRKCRMCNSKNVRKYRNVALFDFFLQFMLLPVEYRMMCM